MLYRPRWSSAATGSSINKQATVASFRWNVTDRKRTKAVNSIPDKILVTIPFIFMCGFNQHMPGWNGIQVNHSRVNDFIFFEKNLTRDTTRIHSSITSIMSLPGNTDIVYEPKIHRWTSLMSPLTHMPKTGIHDDVIKWKHFSCYWPFVRGIHRSLVISHKKASDTELWCFRWFEPEQKFEKKIEAPAIWDVIALIMTSL